MAIAPFKTAELTDDGFVDILEGMFSFFLILVYIVPVNRMISRIVNEKESKIRESMLMMGLTDTPYWLSWLAYYTIINTVLTLIVFGILSISVITNSSKIILFMTLWLYGMSLFGFIMVIQAFFSKARTAAIVGTVLYFFSMYIDMLAYNITVPEYRKILLSIFQTVAISRSAANLALFESTGVGL